LQKLSRSSLETYEGRWIDAVSKISPNRPYRRAITHAEADRVHSVIEVLKVALSRAERDIAERAKDIAHVMEDHALYVLTDERESHFDIVKEKRISP